MERKRIDWIDSIKGFVMLSVVLGHVVNGLIDAEMYRSHVDILKSIQNVVDMYQMPIFAIASGFLFEKVYWKGGKLNKEKYGRQLLNNFFLYFIWDIIFCIIKLMFASQTNNPISISHLVLLPFKAVGPFWYFYILIEFYFVFGIKKIHDMKSAIIIPLCIAFGLFGSWLRIYEIRWLEYASFLFYISFFYIGILTARKKNWRIYDHIIIFISGVFAIAIVMINWNKNNAIYYLPIRSYVVAVGLSFIFMYLFMRLGKVPVLNFVGKHCIEIYTMHIFITSSGRIILRKCNINNTFIAVILIYFLSVVIPLLVATIMKKIKIYDYFYKPIDCIKKLDIGKKKYD